MTLPLEQLLKLEPEEMVKHSERLTQTQLREKTQTYYEDVHVGQELPKYIDTFSEEDLLKWCNATENTHNAHYDYPSALYHDFIPGVLHSGVWRQAILCSWLKDWVLPNGWFFKAGWQVRQMVVMGETTIAWGKITKKYEKGGLGFVDLEIGIKNQNGEEGCPGTATLVLPLKGGRAVPYPFVMPAE